MFTKATYRLMTRLGRGKTNLAPASRASATKEPDLFLTILLEIIDCPSQAQQEDNDHQYYQCGVHK